MQLLLTSAGIKNKSIEAALVQLLGKPIAESSALFIPTGMYPFPRHAASAWEVFCGKTEARFCQLGWKSLNVLELTTLPSIDRKAWVAMVEETDALLVWGGDPLYLSYWMHQSGLAALLPLRSDLVYVGVSAGSMAATSLIGETYHGSPGALVTPLTSEPIVFATPEGDITRTLVTARGLGLTDFSVIPHMDHPNHPDASLANAQRWAAKMPAPVYAIDDDSAIQVAGDAVEVVSEGHWQLFSPQ